MSTRDPDLVGESARGEWTTPEDRERNTITGGCRCVCSDGIRCDQPATNGMFCGLCARGRRIGGTIRLSNSSKVWRPDG